MGVKVYPTEAIYVGQSDKKEIPTEIFQGPKSGTQFQQKLPIITKIVNFGPKIALKGHQGP